MVCTKPLLEGTMSEDVSGNEDWNISLPGFSLLLVLDSRDDGVVMPQGVVDCASTLDGANEIGMFAGSGWYEGNPGEIYNLHGMKIECFGYQSESVYTNTLTPIRSRC
jgi:hypothetical protein